MDDVTTASARTRARGGAGYVFMTLRQEIIALALAPGTVLSRAGLQDRFGLSSTPVRDALMRLQEEGLVDVFPQHATVVSPIDLERAQQGQFLRRSIEIEIVRTLALHPDTAVLERLNSLIRQQTAFSRLGEHSAFTAADQAFHKTMYESANVAELWDLVARHSGHIDRLRRLHLPVPGKMRDVIRDHQAIVDAIAAAKPDEAQAALRDHLSRSLGFVETLRQSHPDYFRR
ncbi:MAG TPA: GntR family transcriptional regulator [Pseudolabrys sp.]|nr:GntR family transcriptional regulator [Pseudolabrys sp.]